jgi:hypothetical protein
VCPLVAGLPRERGEFLLRRLSEVATDTGIPLAPQDCEPNLLVIVSRDPQALMEKWWAHNRRLMNEARGFGGIKRFIHGDQAIRAWYNACSEAPGYAIRPGGGVQCGSGNLGSRLSFEAVRALYSAIVLVDSRRIQDLDDTQLADYAAMVGFAQIREHADPADAPTILGLFGSGTPRPRGLSSWDLSFLRSLYRVEPGSVTQLIEIRLNMDRDLVR